MSDTLRGKSCRRAVRASLRTEMALCMLHCPKLDENAIPVRSISELGAGLEYRQSTVDSRVFDGRLVFDNKIACAVRFRIMHVNPSVTGIEFIKPSRSITLLESAFFIPSFSAPP